MQEESEFENLIGEERERSLGGRGRLWGEEREVSEGGEAVGRRERGLGGRGLEGRGGRGEEREIVFCFNPNP